MGNPVHFELAAKTRKLSENYRLTFQFFTIISTNKELYLICLLAFPNINNVHLIK